MLILNKIVSLFKRDPHPIVDGSCPIQIWTNARQNGLCIKWHYPHIDDVNSRRAFNRMVSEYACAQWADYKNQRFEILARYATAQR